MKKVGNALRQRIVLHAHYFDFQFYIHTFYKLNNITKKSSTKIKTYFQI